MFCRLAQKLAHNCTFDLSLEQTMDMLVSQSDGKFQLVRFFIDETTPSHGGKPPALLPLPGLPSAVNAIHPNFAAHSSSLIQASAVIAGFVLFAAAVVWKRHRNATGYAPIVPGTTKHLYRANPVPVYEEQKLTAAHDRTERFAV